jgi:hypothetical protein
MSATPGRFGRHRRDREREPCREKIVGQSPHACCAVGTGGALQREPAPQGGRQDGLGGQRRGSECGAAIDAGALACHRFVFLHERRCTANATGTRAAERCRRESPRSGNRAALTGARRARTAGSARRRGAKRDSSARLSPRRCSIWHAVSRPKRASGISRGRLPRLPDSVRHPHLAMTRRAARRRVRARGRGILWQRGARRRCFFCHCSVPAMRAYSSVTKMQFRSLPSIAFDRCPLPCVSSTRMTSPGPMRRASPSLAVI